MTIFGQLLIIIFCTGGKMIDLPEPEEVKMPITECIRARRSVRSFGPRELSDRQLSALLWATQGITAQKKGLRSAPSAGATYPLYLYLALKSGLYLYDPETHRLSRVVEEDVRSKISRAALGQGFIHQAPAVFIICADYERTTNRYQKRGIRYVHIEVGHAAENLHLMAVGLGLGSVPVGAFSDKELKKILKTEYEPLYIIPVGYPR
ncbi:MAG TPA: SagB/ThcOx family dehydrogenase [bacterium (Candidatus Stahlbacteria)]|nr:SagB/ThcOx family dehydrogenase [Candidatus Stahlbacteria bacterium]